MQDVRIDRRSLAIQVRDRIREMLRSEHLRAGDQLPSEASLASTFGVSRSSVREALKLLEEERVIVCRHGTGRFLAADPSSLITEDVTRLRSVTDLAQELGIEITTRVLSARVEPADDVVRSHLRLAPGSPVLILERLRQAAGETVIYSVDVLPTTLVKSTVDPEAFTGSLVALIEGQWGGQLAYSRAKISAVNLSDDLSQRVEAKNGVAWVLMEQVNCDAHDQPILYSQDYHRGDMIHFFVLRRRK